MEISQDQLSREGVHDDAPWHSLFDDHALDLCHAAGMNAWDRIAEIGKKNEASTEIMQGQRKASQISSKDQIHQ